MTQFFLNPWLLAGLIGVCLPVIAHLLSRRKVDVVPWAAMQFLNPARRTRRRLKLEELLLLLLRISMIVVLSLAAARPWMPAGMLSGYRSSGSRSVVLVVDGSNSMSRSDGIRTLHQRAVGMAAEFLQTLSSGDSVALIDARDLPRSVIESPVQDLRLVEAALLQLPDPAGGCSLQAAAERAVSILGRTSSASREIVVLTDRHRASWKPEDQTAWDRFEDLLTFPSVAPTMWAIDVGGDLVSAEDNIAVGRIQLNREMTVPEFPVRLNVSIHNSASRIVQVPVRLLLNGQSLADQQQRVDIPASGTASVSFELAIRTIGTHLLSIEAVAVNDPVPADNISHAMLHVTSALSVLLINGVPSVNAVERETFFAGLALTSPGSQTPWIQATTIDAADVSGEIIQSAAMVVLADVRSLPDGIPEELVEFARRGRGVLISCGPNSSVSDFERLFVRSGLLPNVRLLRSREASPDAAGTVRAAPLSLLPGWLDRFRSDPSRSFLRAQFRQWWQTRLLSSSEQAADSPEPPTITKNEDTAAAPAMDQSTTGLSAELPVPVVLAQLTTGDPLLIQTACGDGVVLLLTSSLSRVWNDLPTRSDYVPFLHEAIFQAAAGQVRRNVEVGTPLTASLPGTDDVPPRPGFVTPDGAFAVAVLNTGSQETRLVFRDTYLPGVYELFESDPNVNDDGKAAGAYLPGSRRRLDRFVVNYDHAEDDMTPLSEADQSQLAVRDRVRFVGSQEELHRRMYRRESRTELWALLLLLFPGLLTVEVWLTRRMAQTGHGE